MLQEKDVQPDTFSFRSMMRDVKPLKDNRKADLSASRKKSDQRMKLLRRQAAVARPAQNTLGLSDLRVEPLAPDAYLSFHLADLPLRTFQQLRQGQIPWQEGLDLHGYTLEQASQQLSSFIRDACTRGYRCVLVVHGKAYQRNPQTRTIKAYLPVWLEQLPSVLAYVSALPADGGTGAVYVLLRTKNKP